MRMQITEMKRLIILIFACLIGARSECLIHSPDGSFPAGCNIGNLTVTTSLERDIVSNSSCGEKIIGNYIPYNIKFHRMSKSVAQSYLLAVIDVTTHQLLGMMSNLTMQYDLIFTSSEINNNIQALKPWSKLFLTSSSQQRRINYLVFEEHRNQSALNYTNNSALTQSPFNLSVWINSQQRSGITICGPVAGGSVMLRPPLPEAPTLRTLRPIVTTTTTTTRKYKMESVKVKCKESCKKDKKCETKCKIKLN